MKILHFILGKANKDRLTTNGFTKDYMKMIGHTEFGLTYVPLKSEGIKFEDCLNINHWLDQYCLVYEEVVEKYSKLKNVYFLGYESL